MLRLSRYTRPFSAPRSLKHVSLLHVTVYPVVPRISAVAASKPAGCCAGAQLLNYLRASAHLCRPRCIQRYLNACFSPV